MDIQYLTLLERILFLLVEFCRNAPGSYCGGCVDTGCRLECCFCRLEFFLYPAYSRGAWSLILPCRMLGDTGNSHWKMPCNDLHGMTQDEPCSCSISRGRINSVCRNILELLDCVWKHCSSCIICGNTTVFCTRR